MERCYLRTAAIVVCLLSGAAAQGVPVTYDFTGRGTIDWWSAPTSPHTFTGWMTVDVNLAGQRGDHHNGWVESDFFIDWGSGSFNPGPVVEQAYSDMYASVSNGDSVGFRDEMVNREYYQRNVGDVWHYSYAQLDRSTSDISWLSDRSFDTSKTLATGPDALNWLRFRNDVFGDDKFYGSVYLDSLTIRPTSVPEPGTLILFGLGLAGLGSNAPTSRSRLITHRQSLSNAAFRRRLRSEQPARRSSDRALTDTSLACA